MRGVETHDRQVLQKIAELLFEIDSKEKPPVPVAPPPPAPKPSKEWQKRLFNQAQVRENKLQQKRSHKQQQEVKSMKQFKVENKETKKIIERKPTPPLAERTKDIMKNREQRQTEHLHRREEEARKRRETDEKEMEEFNKEIDERRMNPEVYNRKQEEYQNQRMLHMRDLSLKQFERYARNNTYQPEINTASKEILKNYRPQFNDISFLERQEMYDQQRQKSMARLKFQVDRKVMPFHPNLTDRERSESRRKLLTERSINKKSLSPAQEPLPENKRKTPKLEIMVPEKDPHQRAAEVTFFKPNGNKKTLDSTAKRPAAANLKSTTSQRKISSKQLTAAKSVSKLGATNTHPHISVTHQPDFGREQSNQRTLPKEFRSHYDRDPSLLLPESRINTEALDPSMPQTPGRQSQLRQLIYRHRNEVMTFFKDLSRKDSNRHTRHGNRVSKR